MDASTYPTPRGRGGRGFGSADRGRGTRGNARGRGQTRGAPAFHNATWRRPEPEQPTMESTEDFDADADAFFEAVDVKETGHFEQHEQEYAEEEHEAVEEEEEEEENEGSVAFDVDADVPGMDFMALETKAERDAYYQKLKAGHAAEFKYAVEHGLLDAPGVQKSLKDAITVVGTCEQMCPLLQSVEREQQARLSFWEKIPGTNRVDVRRAVKYYERATGDRVVPSDVRPPHVLKKTLDYLFHTLSPSHPFFDTQDFISDRSRAVRNDFTLQHIDDHRAIRANYRCLRFHIITVYRYMHEGTGGKEFNKENETRMIANCLESLKEFWSDALTRRQQEKRGQDVEEEEDELEFWLYYRIWHIRYSVPRVEHMSPGIQEHPVLKLATKFRAAIQDASVLKKNTPLKTSPEALKVFSELAAALNKMTLGGGGGRVMTFLFACLLDWHFGKGTVPQLHELRGDLEDWEIIDGISRDPLIQDVNDAEGTPETGGDVDVDEATLTEAEEEPQETQDVVEPQQRPQAPSNPFGLPATSTSAFSQSNNPFANYKSPFGDASPFAAIDLSKSSAFGLPSSTANNSSAFGHPTPGSSGSQPVLGLPVTSTSAQAKEAALVATFLGKPSAFGFPTIVPSKSETSTSSSTLNPFAKPFSLPSISSSNDLSISQRPTPPSLSISSVPTATPSPAPSAQPIPSGPAPSDSISSLFPPAVSNNVPPSPMRPPPGAPRRDPVALPTSPMVDSGGSAWTIPPISPSPSPQKRAAPPVTPSGNASLKSLFKGSSLSSLKTTELGPSGGELSPLVMSPAVSRANSLRAFGEPVIGGVGGGLSPSGAATPLMATPFGSMSSIPTTLPPDFSRTTPSSFPSGAPTPEPSMTAQQLERKKADLLAKAATLRERQSQRVVKDAYARWSVTFDERRSAKRARIDKAAEDGEEYHRRVALRRSMNGSVASSGRSTPVRDLLGSSLDSHSASHRKRRTRKSEPFRTDAELARRFEENHSANIARWKKGSFLDQLKRLHGAMPPPALPTSSFKLSSSQSAAWSLFSAPPTIPVSGNPTKELPWDIWLSLNDDRESTAIWLEEKFTSPEMGKPQWQPFESGDRGVLVVAAPGGNAPGPGLVIFELTPPRDGDDIENKYLAVDDLARLKALLKYLHEDSLRAKGGGRFVPAVILVSWHHDVEHQAEIKKMLKGELETSTSTMTSSVPCISSHGIFRPSLAASTLDSDFRQCVASLDLDWEGRRGRWVEPKTLWRSFDTALEPFVDEWLSACSPSNRKGKRKAEEFDYGLYSLLLKTLVDIVQTEEDRLSDMALTDQTMAHLHSFNLSSYEDIDDDDSLYEVALTWLHDVTQVGGDDESYQNVAMHRTMGQAFPAHPFIEYIRRLPLNRIQSRTQSSALANGTSLTNESSSPSSASKIWVPHHIIQQSKHIFEDAVQRSRASLVHALTMRRRRRASNEDDSVSRKRRRLAGGSASPGASTVASRSELESYISGPASPTRSGTPMLNGAMEDESMRGSISRSTSPEKVVEDGPVTVSMLRELTKNMRAKLKQIDS